MYILREKRGAGVAGCPQPENLARGLQVFTTPYNLENKLIFEESNKQTNWGSKVRQSWFYYLLAM